MTWAVVAAVLIAVAAAAVTLGVRAQRSRARRPPAMEFIPLGETRRQLPVFDPGTPAPPTFVKEPGFEAFARPAAPDAICFLTGRVVETCTCAKHKAKGANP